MVGRPPKRTGSLGLIVMAAIAVISFVILVWFDTQGAK